MTPLIKRKTTAFLIHLILSILVILTFLSLVFFIWYPESFLKMEGGLIVIMVLVAVDIIVGPSLTFIVFNPDKKELYFDLSVIVLLQIIAFGYGAFIIYEERPVYVSFYENWFTLIPASSIDIDDLEDKSLETHIFDSPRFVYVQIPTTRVERKELIATIKKEGKTEDFLPKYYRSYQENMDYVIKGSASLNLKNILKKHPEQKVEIEKIAQNLAIESLVYYPIKGNMEKRIIVLNPNDGQMLGILAIAP